MSSCVKWTGRKLTCLSKTIRAGMKRRGQGQIRRSWFYFAKYFGRGGFKLITGQAPKQSNLCQLVPNYARCCQFWLSNKSVPVYITSRLKPDWFWSLFGLISFAHMESICSPDVHLQWTTEWNYSSTRNFNPVAQHHSPVASPHQRKDSSRTKICKTFC